MEKYSEPLCTYYLASTVNILVPYFGTNSCSRPLPWDYFEAKCNDRETTHNFICKLSERFLMKLNIVKTVNIAAYDLFKNIIKSLLKQVSHILEFYSICIFPSKICWTNFLTYIWMWLPFWLHSSMYLKKSSS